MYFADEVANVMDRVVELREHRGALRFHLVDPNAMSLIICRFLIAPPLRSPAADLKLLPEL